MFLLPLYYQELRGFDVLGAALVLIPVMTVAFVDIDPDDMPDASMLIRISQQLGGSFGVAIDAVLVDDRVHRARRAGLVLPPGRRPGPGRSGRPTTGN